MTQKKKPAICSGGPQKLNCTLMVPPRHYICNTAALEKRDRRTLKSKLLLIGALLSAIDVHAQFVSFLDASNASRTVPWRATMYEPGVCSGPEVYYNLQSGKLRICTSGAWTDLVSGGSGGGATIATTRSILVGDFAGNAIPISGPANCTGGQVATGISATGVANCITPPSGGASSTSQLTDLFPVQSGATLTIGNGSTPCGVVTGSPTVTLTGGSGTAYIWISCATSTPVLHVGLPAAGTGVITVTCSGLGCTPETATSFPAPGLYPIKVATAQSTTFPSLMWSAITDQRQFLTPCPNITSGVGATATWTGSGCDYQISASGGGATMQSIPYWFLSSDVNGTTPAQGISASNSAVVSGSGSGSLNSYLTASTGTATAVVIHHTLPLASRDGTGGWDGSAINMNLTWTNLQGGSGNVQFQVSTFCSGVGASVTPSFTNTTTTQVAVPASFTMAVTQLGVPLGTCAAGNILFVKLVHVLPANYTGTGSAYGSGVNLYGATLLVKQ